MNKKNCLTFGTNPKVEVCILSPFNNASTATSLTRKFPTSLSTREFVPNRGISCLDLL
ncbi:MAG: hypothetical protein ACOYMF_15460 [Bacteroidales bacterium]